MNGFNSTGPSSSSEMNRCPSKSFCRALLDLEFLAAILIPTAMHWLRAYEYIYIYDGVNFELCYLLFTFSEAVLVEVYSSVLA